MITDFLASRFPNSNADSLATIPNEDVTFSLLVLETIGIYKYLVYIKNVCEEDEPILLGRVYNPLLLGRRVVEKGSLRKKQKTKKKKKSKSTKRKPKKRKTKKRKTKKA